jgi:hypothetical protein
MSGRGNAQGAIDAGRRMLEQAVDAGIKRSRDFAAKPTLRRYSWSRLHTDLLDDFRWSLVAKRANAPLPLVEAVVVRLENHANRSLPRGHVGDFSAEGLAARWNVEADVIGRIYAELERPDIGWIDQDQIVTFWDRNPDKVDDTAADRQQRARDRKKGMKQLASAARQGFISDQQRREREQALKDSGNPKALMAAWAENLSTDASRCDSVTVTTRAEQIIKQDLPGKEESGSAGQEVGSGFFPDGGVNVVGFGQAQLWLETEGLKLVTARMQSLAPRARTLMERWSAGVDGDLAALMAIILGAVGTSAIGEAFQNVVENQIGRRKLDAEGPRLPLPPVGLRRSG